MRMLAGGRLAAAGLWTTPGDLAKAGVVLQHILRGDGGGILLKETLEEMLKPQIGEEMGLGFFCMAKERVRASATVVGTRALLPSRPSTAKAARARSS